MNFFENICEPKLRRLLNSPDLNEPNRALKVEKYLKNSKKLKDLKRKDYNDSFDSFISTLVRDNVFTPNRAVSLIKILHKILDYKETSLAIEETVKLPMDNLVCLEILTSLIDEKAEDWWLIGLKKHSDLDTDRVQTLTIYALQYLVKNYQFLANLLFSKFKIFQNFGTIAFYLTDLIYKFFSNDFFKTFFYSFNSNYKNYGVEDNPTEQKINIHLFYKVFICVFVDFLELFYQRINKEAMKNFLKKYQAYADKGENLTREKYFYDTSNILNLKKLVFSNMKKIMVKNYSNWVDLRFKVDNYFDQNVVTSHIEGIKLIKLDIKNDSVE